MLRICTKTKAVIIEKYPKRHRKVLFWLVANERPLKYGAQQALGVMLSLPNTNKKQQVKQVLAFARGVVGGGPIGMDYSPTPIVAP